MEERAEIFNPKHSQVMKKREGVVAVRKVIFFDSGMGGLSIWQAVNKFVPAIECHYLFDHAYFPYGELAEPILIKRVCDLIPALAEQVGADAVVIACNTASTSVLVPLRQLLTIPIVGVVPAIKPAAALSQTRHIALLATPATVNRSYTHRLVNDYAEGCQVTYVGSSALVKIAEQYLLTGALDLELVRQEVATIAQQETIDTLVLGCTHFPIIKEALATVLGQRIRLIDSGEAIARQLQRILPSMEHGKAQVEHEYYYTCGGEMTKKKKLGDVPS